MFDRFWKVSVLVVLTLLLATQVVDLYLKFRVKQELEAGKQQLEAEFADKARRIQDDLDVAKREFRRLNDTLDFFVTMVEEMLGIRPIPRDGPLDREKDNKMEAPRKLE